MSTLLYRLGRAAYRRALLVIGVWVLVLAAVVGDNTADRWTAAMTVCVEACAPGGIDPAVPVVRALLRVRPQGADLPAGMAVFAAPLALAGLLPR